jgi:MOSC domain-containing protein YiiM
MLAVDMVRAVPGRGLVGDRYHDDVGRFAGRGHELTLVEAESLDTLEAELGVKLHPSDTRRNVVVRGVRLESLVGRSFYLGAVLVRGDEPCRPCVHLEPVKRDRRVLHGLVDRGGLRASILDSGWIAVGDRIRADS